MVVNRILFRLENYVKGDRLLRYSFAPSVEFVGVGRPTARDTAESGVFLSER